MYKPAQVKTRDMRKERAIRMKNWLKCLAALALCAALSACARADVAQWQSMGSSARMSAVWKDGKVVDHKINFGVNYINAAEDGSVILRIYNRHVWYEGELEVTTPGGAVKTVPFKYDEAYKPVFDANLAPGQRRSRNYYFFLKADGALKGYSPASKYRIVSLNAVRHEFTCDVKRKNGAIEKITIK